MPSLSINGYTNKILMMKGKEITFAVGGGAPPVSANTWVNGTDEEVAAALALHHANQINLHEYWNVGDERVVHLSAMARTGVGEAHAEQDVTFVLVNAGGQYLANGKECAFIVQQKDCLNTTGYLHSTSSAVVWASCQRRTWCNSVYRNAIPIGMREIFKLYVNKTAVSHSSQEESEDYFSFPEEYNVYGSNTYSYINQDAIQWEYYKTASNRIKKVNGSSSAWWERSKRTNSSSDNIFCLVGANGDGFISSSANPYGIAPFGCI